MADIDWVHWLVVAAVVFFIGVIGFMNRDVTSRDEPPGLPPAVSAPAER